MARPPKLAASALTHRLKTAGPLSAAALAEVFQVDRSTVTRSLGGLGGEIASLGATRRTRYALRRKVRQMDACWPLYRIDAEGRAETAGTLEAYHGAWRMSWAGPLPPWADGSSDPEGLSPRLPFFLRELAPRGYLGRAAARQLAAGLQVPEDTGRWSDDDLLLFLHAAGEDLPGHWIVGDACLRRALSLQVQPSPETTLAPHQAMTRYPELALRSVNSPLTGALAGGEQPKFLATLEESGIERKPVLVKFSPPMIQGTGRRWADLLAMEAIARDLLADAGLTEGGHRLIDAGGRRFLELPRFDRTRRGGRLGVMSLESIHGGDAGDWSSRAADLRRAGLVDDAVLRDVRRLQAFGELIGNTGMHAGNLSFRQSDRLPLELAPAYDMLPMLWAPGPQGELMERSFAPQPPVPAAAGEWREMLDRAREFWQRVIADPRVSRDFAATARAAGEVLARLGERFG